MSSLFAVSRTALVFAAALGLVACAAPAADTSSSSEAQALVAGALPTGSYHGAGNYVDPTAPGKSGPYDAAFTVAGDSIDVRYAFGRNGSGGELTLGYRLTWKTAHEFAFTVDARSEDGATGYCIDDRCHFSAVSGGQVAFEMTLVFGPRSITSVGSKLEGDHRVFWSETLEKV